MEITIAVLMFAIPLVFLLWLAEKHPPYDPQPEMQRMKQEMEDKLEAYKKSLK